MTTPNDLPGSGGELVPLPDILSLLTRAEFGFVQLTPDGDISVVNDAFADLSGYSRDELLGTSFTSYLATVPSPLESLFRRESEAGEPASSVLPLETADGDILVCKAQLAAVREEDAVIGLFTPQSDRESESPQLNPEHDDETAAKAFIALADSLSDGIIVLDTASRIQYANPAVEDILGYSSEELVGESKLSIIPERLREAHLSGLNRYLETGERNIDWRYVELPGQHEDGHEVPLGISLNDFFFEGNRYFVGLFRDISERKEVERALRERERQLEELVEKLEESNERLEQFAYAASHDLQEPLRMVTSYLSLVERRYGDELDEDGEEFLEFAVDGAERMREMIDALLEYSRVDTQGDPLEPTDLNEVLADVRTDLTVKIEETDARIESEELPRVRGDDNQLRQLFQNLLDNALTYTGEEPPRVEITAERDGEEWILSVSDNGVGIDPEDTDRVFQVFQSLHTREEGGGTGIGLALCKRIAERHGGDIRVDSEPGGGTTFSVSLPAASDDG
ncbi:sensor histidine kinase [Halopelagius fulvigenes]|uniref:histidine kinase n=1 Tax=Halopelagius fulvigenes TaxID=1198324 RepID=A0ABD5U094_9EURY